MSTRAITFLSKKRIPFEVLKYEHEEKGAEFAARATGFSLEQTVKTLVAALGCNKYCLALMPGHRELNMKRLAKVFAVKSAAMVDAATAERLTGYLVGGISPFGIKHQLPVVMDESILDFGHILINAGQRGVMLKMTPNDILNTLDCKVAELAR
jgi:Cys-tRNA(Pro)/Cys-tRNA(Cys) deacylase